MKAERAVAMLFSYRLRARWAVYFVDGAEHEQRCDQPLRCSFPIVCERDGQSISSTQPSTNKDATSRCDALFLSSASETGSLLRDRAELEQRPNVPLRCSFPAGLCVKARLVALEAKRLGSWPTPAHQRRRGHRSIGKRTSSGRRRPLHGHVRPSLHHYSALYLYCSRVKVGRFVSWSYRH